MSHTESFPVEPLTEAVADWRADDLEIARDSRLVKNVVLSGPVSRNGYRYSEQALREAVALYAGKPVFLDHAPQGARPYDRSTRDLVGSVHSARYERDRIRGDIQVLETEAGRTFLALLEGPSTAVGMSHVILAQRDGSGQTVERIHDVVSVDAVVFPATTHSLREGEHGAEEPVSTEVALLSEMQQLRDELATRSREVRQLREQLDQTDRALDVATLLAESALPAQVVTPLFRQQLARAASSDERRQLIEERRQLVQFASPLGSQARSGGGLPIDRAFVQAVRGRTAGVLQRTA